LQIILEKVHKTVNRGIWLNVGALLKQHENSPDHFKNMVQWKDFAICLSKKKTIDATEMALLEAEKNLAERNLELRDPTLNVWPGLAFCLKLASLASLLNQHAA